jgi:hypothetical protein
MKHDLSAQPGRAAEFEYDNTLERSLESSLHKYKFLFACAAGYILIRANLRRGVTEICAKSGKSPFGLREKIINEAFFGIKSAFGVSRA